MRRPRAPRSTATRAGGPSGRDPPLRDLADHPEHVVYLVAPDGDGLLYVNPAFRALFGTDPPAKLEGWTERVHPADRDAHLDFRRRIRRREEARSEYRIVAEGGSMRRIVDRAYPVGGGEDGPEWVVGLAVEVSEERRVERAHHLLSEAAVIMSPGLDRGQILAGLTRLMVPAMGDWCRVHLLDGTGELEAVAGSHVDPGLAERVASLDGGLPDPDGRGGALHVTLSGRPILMKDSDPERLAGASPDPAVTALLEELGVGSAMIVPLAAGARVFGAVTVVNGPARRQYRDEDLDLATELATAAAVGLEHDALLEAELAARSATEEARRQAHESRRARLDFLSIASHELRTPLNAIVGYGDLLESEVSGPLTPSQRKHLSRIRASAWRLLTLIEEVLDLARVEAGKIELVPEEIDMEELAAEAADLVRPDVRGKELLVRVEGPEGPVRLVADRSRVRQILVSLLLNAVESTDAGVVVLSFEELEDEVRVHVRDTGPGIAPDSLEAIFEPFSRAEGAGAGGAGLGLSLSRRFARLMDGDVTVESRPGEGSVFTVRLPVRPHGGG